MNQTTTASIRVLTLNCWGLPFISKDLPARIQAIGEAIAEMGVDLVGLQEVFRKEDRDTIEQRTSHVLPYSRYFPSRFIGSGLLILSRFPILQSGFQPYLLNGRPQDLVHSDYYAGKGFGWVIVEGPLGPLCLYNTHLIAPYLEIGSDVFYGHRVGQAIELVEHIHQQPDNLPVILTADLNHTPEGIVYPFLRDAAKMQDSFAAANQGSTGVTVTTDIPYLLIHEPERIDYIWSRNSTGTQILTERSEVVFRQVPKNTTGKIQAFSDHYGVLSTLTLQKALSASERSSPAPQIFAELRGALINAMDATKKQRGENLVWLLVASSAAIFLGKYGLGTTLPRRKFLQMAFRLLSLAFATGALVSFSLAFRLPSEVAIYQNLLARLSTLEAELSVSCKPDEIKILV